MNELQYFIDKMKRNAAHTYKWKTRWILSVSTNERIKVNKGMQSQKKPRKTFKMWLLFFHVRVQSYLNQREQRITIYILLCTFVLLWLKTRSCIYGIIIRKFSNVKVSFYSCKETQCVTAPQSGYKKTVGIVVVATRQSKTNEISNEISHMQFSCLIWSCKHFNSVWEIA